MPGIALAQVEPRGKIGVGLGTDRLAHVGSELVEQALLMLSLSDPVRRILLRACLPEEDPDRARAGAQQVLVDPAEEEAMHAPVAGGLDHQVPPIAQDISDRLDRRLADLHLDGHLESSPDRAQQGAESAARQLPGP